jgi:hypothetical protein
MHPFALGTRFRIGPNLESVYRVSQPVYYVLQTVAFTTCTQKAKKHLSLRIWKKKYYYNIYVCMYAYTYVCMYVYTHIHTHTHVCTYLRRSPRAPVYALIAANEQLAAHAVDTVSTATNSEKSVPWLICPRPKPSLRAQKTTVRPGRAARAGASFRGLGPRKRQIDLRFGACCHLVRFAIWCGLCNLRVELNLGVAVLFRMCACGDGAPVGASLAFPAWTAATSPPGHWGLPPIVA